MAPPTSDKGRQDSKLLQDSKAQQDPTPPPNFSDLSKDFDSVIIKARSLQTNIRNGLTDLRVRKHDKASTTNNSDDEVELVILKTHYDHAVGMISRIAGQVLRWRDPVFTIRERQSLYLVAMSVEVAASALNVDMGEEWKATIAELSDWYEEQYAASTRGAEAGGAGGEDAQ